MSRTMKLGMIGLDTSHSIEFTRLMQGDAAEKVPGLRVVTCMRFPSAFYSEEKQDERQKQLETWGVKVTRRFDEAVEGMDGLLLEINDPALHWKYFQPAARTGLPIYLDKPLAGSLAEGRRIVNLAAKLGLKMWGSSSLRFAPELVAAHEALPEPVLANVFGPLGAAASGSSLVWYGCHAFEMLSAVMVTPARTVRAAENARGVVAIVEFDNGRQGVVECNRDIWQYGGRIQNGRTTTPFAVGHGSLYRNLVLRIGAFMRKGVAPVAPETMLNVQSMMDAAERSLLSGQTERVRS